MKKIFSYMLLALSMPLLAACDTDTDSNPTLQEPESFVLNVPPLAANNVYDLQNAKTVELTCTQPAYSFPAATTYTVQATLDQTFIEDGEGTTANYVSLPSTYRAALLQVDAYELNEALSGLWDATHPGEDLPAYMPVTLRLKANITDSERGVCYSNAIVLPKVRVSKPVQLLELPESMYIVGSMPASGWSTWLPFAAVNGTPGMFYAVVYCPANANFKIGPASADWEQARTYDQMTFTPEAVSIAGAEPGTDSGNSAVRNAGWYTFVVTTKIVGKEITYTVDIREAELFLIGATLGGQWDFSDAGRCTLSTDETEWITPAATEAGEARMSVKVPDAAWWQTEFTLNNGAIFYRENNNILNNWESDLGSAYSVKLTAGQRIRLNFSTGTGVVE
ncbi:MAG: SusF/SusE family outer membrane protein [Prevotellamassilia sp.]|nr:SusF/SusE family outer membrane protein [Prevotellamassilia sp.]